MKRILVINPGSTSTKAAVYHDAEPVLSVNVQHDTTTLNGFSSLKEQAAYRQSVIEEFLRKEGIALESLDIVMCRGGLILTPKMSTGGYEVDEALYEALQDDEKTQRHASQFGGLIGKRIADRAGIKAYIYDCVTAADIMPIAQITGMPEITRRSFCHVLNGRATAIKYAESKGKSLEELRLIVAHLGGGCSTMVFEGGRIIDSMGDDDGPYGPERAGSVPVLQLIDLCMEGKYTKDELKKMVRGKGGLYAHLGTSDCREIEEKIAQGDEYAALVYQAQAYQLAKAISMNGVTLKGKVDAILLTGGVANSKLLTDWIAEYVSFIAPVVVLPGENEMEALALGGMRILSGEELPKKI